MALLRGTEGSFDLRYEDVDQNGRLRLEAAAASLGLVWEQQLSKDPLEAYCQQHQILPILTRIVAEGGEGPFSLELPIRVEGGFQLARTVDAAGNTRRLMMNVETVLTAPKGRTNLPPPDDAGAIAPVARVLAEHVFTRPFAPKEERRVTSLGAEVGVDAPLYDFREPAGLLELPPGAEAIDLFREERQLTFGAMHSDSNQHVNSLVYPRLFEEAALERLVSLGHPASLLSRGLDVRYRKPSFIGDRVAIVLRIFRLEGALHAVGAFVEPGQPIEQGRAFVQLKFG